MFDDFNQPPALQATERASFHDANRIADLGFALFVVDIEPLAVLHDLSEARMGHSSNGFDDAGFLHFGRNDLTNTIFS